MPRNDTIETIAHDAPNLDYVAKTLEFEGLDAREALSRDARDTLSGKMMFDEKARQIREEARLQQLMAKDDGTIGQEPTDYVSKGATLEI